MAGEAAGRPLLPQTAQMQSFTFAPPTLAPRENQRNYVFVDEHNRHKRLKVMRACEGCRRRKIKCDAATTNSWPCAACIRLKLNCVPPTVSYDKDSQQTSHTFELPRTHEYSAPVQPVTDSYQQQHPIPHHFGHEVASTLTHATPVSYAPADRMYQAAPYIEPAPTQDQLQYGQLAPPPVQTQDLGYHSQQIYSAPPPTSMPPNLTQTGAEGAWRTEMPSGNLADALGDLKIEHDAVAPYLISERKTLASAPAMAEYKVHLPQSTSEHGELRIPPEMMPSDQQAIQYFDSFFTHIHPYVPVLNKGYFLQQWHTNRKSISPLLLEAIFACGALMVDGTREGAKWLGLASEHEESFRDVPRLSTIQATLIMMKAREQLPQRGYFYRSWTSIENLVAMAKELDLDKHLRVHRFHQHCDSDPLECSIHTRVWQTIFVLEFMIGAPQGRFEFGVRLETVDFSIPPPPENIPGQDPNVVAEAQVSHQFTYLARLVREIQRSNSLHAKLREFRKDWAIDPEFIQHNADFAVWIRDLPQDLQIPFPRDGSTPPYLQSHFIANINCYYYLAIIMHHRPQLFFLSQTDLYDPSWKQHMAICYSAAKNLCRIQEALLRDYGLDGLLYMQRGVGFTVYAALTCIMLHLAAASSPDHEYADARDFFVRHMRILEQCTNTLAMPELLTQINNLREAFSADLSKPFELKPSFPLGSPGATSASPLSEAYRARGPATEPSMEQPGQVQYTAHPITPPISATDTDPKADSPVVQSLVMMAAGQRQPPQSNSVQAQDASQWNPTKIFDSFNTAFGTPPPSTASQSSPPLRAPPSGNFEQLRTPQDTHPPGFPSPVNLSPNAGHLPNMPAQLPPPVSYANQNSAFVTPSMWQDAVASSFGDGLKRRWDYGAPGMIEQGHMTKRPR